MQILRNILELLNPNYTVETVEITMKPEIYDEIAVKQIALSRYIDPIYKARTMNQMSTCPKWLCLKVKI